MNKQELQIIGLEERVQWLRSVVMECDRLKNNKSTLPNPISHLCNKGSHNKSGKKRECKGTKCICKCHEL